MIRVLGLCALVLIGLVGLRALNRFIDRLVAKLERPGEGP